MDDLGGSSCKIDEDIKARLKRLADSRQRTSHWLMREAISQYVAREEHCEAFRLKFGPTSASRDLGAVASAGHGQPDLAWRCVYARRTALMRR